MTLPPSEGISALPNTFSRLSVDTSKRTQKDWSLPPLFISYLGKDPDQAISELVPPRSPTAISTSNLTALATHLEVESQPQGLGPDIRTEKGALAHKSTKSQLVDLFFDYCPGITPKDLFSLLEKAWKEDALATLKIVFHARSIHEGKGFKEGFFRAMGWIWDKHPRTLLDNLHLIVDPTCKRDRDPEKVAKAKQRREKTLLNEGDRVIALDDLEGEDDDMPEYPARPHGSFDDLIDLLILHINNQLTSAYEGPLSSIDETLAPASSATHFKQARLQLAANPGTKRDRGGFKHILKAAAAPDTSPYTRKLWRASSSLAKHQLLHSRAETALTTDKKFIALYLRVLQLFVDYIEDDLSRLAKHHDFLSLPEASRKPYKGDSSPYLYGMSLAAKWVPTPNHAADKQTMFATALSMLLFPGDGIEISRHKLQKRVLTPLRQVLAVPEVPMSDGTWKINYPKVPGKSMSRNSAAFFKHDPEGFETFLRRVAEGGLSISGASLKPHEILIDATDTSAPSPLTSRIADLQWQSLVNSIRSSSSKTLENCLAIADVSGSMGRLGSAHDKKNPQPIVPCIALTLLLGELASPPWNGTFFTFSSSPKSEFIDPTLPLSMRASTLNRAHWEMSTNFYKVFDLILTNALQAKLAPEQMIKKLFVFSDMQFDQAANGKFDATEHETIQAKFTKAGYPMPELVYWNLSSRVEGIPKPVTSDTPGVSLMSGFSGALMKYFLRGEGAVEGETEEDMVEIDRSGEGMFTGHTANGSSPLNQSNCDDDFAFGQGMRRVGKNPLQVVREIVSAECYNGLKVVD